MRFDDERWARIKGMSTALGIPPEQFVNECVDIVCRVVVAETVRSSIDKVLDAGSQPQRAARDVAQDVERRRRRQRDITNVAEASTRGGLKHSFGDKLAAALNKEKKA